MPSAVARQRDNRPRARVSAEDIVHLKKISGSEASVSTSATTSTSTTQAFTSFSASSKRPRAPVGADDVVHLMRLAREP